MHIAFLYFIIFESTPSSLITPSMPCQSSTDDTAVSSVDAVEGCHKSTQKSFEDNAYEIPKLAGRWTLLELVELSINKDPRLTKVPFFTPYHALANQSDYTIDIMPFHPHPLSQLC